MVASTAPRFSLQYLRPKALQKGQASHMGAGTSAAIVGAGSSKNCVYFPFFSSFASLHMKKIFKS
jgi:hypothetical protein